MDDYENLERFNGLWCIFPSDKQVLVQFGSFFVNDAVKIHRVEEISVLFGGIAYIRFQAAHNPSRVIEVFGAWSIKSEWQEPKF